MTSCPWDQTFEVVLNELNYLLLFPVQTGHALREGRQTGRSTDTRMGNSNTSGGDSSERSVVGIGVWNTCMAGDHATEEINHTPRNSEVETLKLAPLIFPHLPLRHL